MLSEAFRAWANRAEKRWQALQILQFADSHRVRDCSHDSSRLQEECVQHHSVRLCLPCLCQLPMAVGQLVVCQTAFC